MDFVSLCYHRGREHCQAVDLNLFLGMPEEDGYGLVVFDLFDNRSGDELSIEVPLEHMEYMAETEALERGSGWREFLVCYLDAALEDMGYDDE